MFTKRMIVHFKEFVKGLTVLLSFLFFSFLAQGQGTNILSCTDGSSGAIQALRLLTQELGKSNSLNFISSKSFQGKGIYITTLQ